MTRVVPLAAVIVALAAGVVAGAQDAAHANADAMRRKVAILTARGEAPRQGRREPQRTTFTDDEVNDYFRIDGHEFLPAGVVDPHIQTDEGGRVHADARVDLDAVKKAQPPSMFSPLNLLSGTVEIRAVAVVHGADGVGTLSLESVALGGVPVPISVLQLVVSSYTRSPDLPQGFDLSQPFPLPSNIMAVEIHRGLSSVVQ